MIYVVMIAEALTALRHNVLRSALTAIGVMIGVSGVIVLGASGGGASKLIEQQITAEGRDTLNVMVRRLEAGAQRGPVVVLTDADAAAVREQVPGIRYMSREVYSRVTLVAGNASWTTEYWAVDASYKYVYDVRIAEGRFFDEDEVDSGARVAVLGATVAKELFGTQSVVGRSIRMGGVPVEVIGLRTRLGSVGGVDYDNFIIVPVTTARSRLPQEGRVKAQQLNMIDLKVFPGTDLVAIKASIRSVLRERKSIPPGAEDGIYLRDTATVVAAMNATHATLSGLLAASTLISLAVGGVGIMNIMLVSVTERTHEIGLRMAIGARKRDILVQFVAEATVLCVLAGIVGVLLGVAGSAVVAKASGWPLIIAPWTIALALAAAVGTGIGFGYLPAHRAANLDPIEALRRE